MITQTAHPPPYFYGLNADQISLPYNAIGLTRQSNICKIAEGFKSLSKILCFMEKGALFALRLKCFSVTKNLAVLKKFTPRYF